VLQYKQSVTVSVMLSATSRRCESVVRLATSVYEIKYLDNFATEWLYTSWCITACKASFNNQRSFLKASKNRYTIS
jgi:hypothetical protein